MERGSASRVGASTFLSDISWNAVLVWTFLGVFFLAWCSVEAKKLQEEWIHPQGRAAFGQALWAGAEHQR